MFWLININHLRIKKFQKYLLIFATLLIEYCHYSLAIDRLFFMLSLM